MPPVAALRAVRSRRSCCPGRRGRRSRPRRARRWSPCAQLVGDVGAVDQHVTAARRSRTRWPPPAVDRAGPRCGPTRPNRSRVAAHGTAATRRGGSVDVPVRAARRRRRRQLDDDAGDPAVHDAVAHVSVSIVVALVIVTAPSPGAGGRATHRSRARRRRGRHGGAARVYGRCGATSRPARRRGRPPASAQAAPASARPARSRRPRPRRGGAVHQVGPDRAERAASGATIVGPPRRAAQHHRLVAGPAREERGRAAARAARAAVGVRHEHRVPRPAGRDVEVRRAPDAAVDVLAPADRHGREDPRHRAGGQHRVGDLARGAPGAPKTTRRPLRRSTAAIAQPAVEGGPSALEVLARGRASVRVRRARAAAGRRRGRGAPGGRAVARRAARAARRVPWRPRRAARQRAGRAPAGGRASAAAAASPRARRDSPLGPAPGGQHGGDDRAGGRPDEVSHRGGPGRAGLEAGEHAAQPRLAEHPAAAEDQRVGKVADRAGHRRA